MATSPTRIARAGDVMAGGYVMAAVYLSSSAYPYIHRKQSLRGGILQEDSADHPIQLAKFGGIKKLERPRNLALRMLESNRNVGRARAS